MELFPIRRSFQLCHNGWVHAVFGFTSLLVFRVMFQLRVTSVYDRVARPTHPPTTVRWSIYAPQTHLLLHSRLLVLFCGGHKSTLLPWKWLRLAHLQRIGLDTIDCQNLQNEIKEGSFDEFSFFLVSLANVHPNVPEMHQWQLFGSRT